MGHDMAFHKPTQNWFKMPNDWTDITYGMTLSELKVVEYVLRHTWGFSEYDSFKHITLDEFMHGRRRKDGTRMDKGTGLSEPSIIEGLKKAIEHNHLEVVRKGDNGRICKSYKLKIFTDSDEGPSKEFLEGPLKEFKTDQRKTPLRKTLINSLSGVETPDHTSHLQSSENLPDRTQPTAWDYKAADELSKVISSAVKVNKRMDRKSWANVFRVMRTRDKIPKAEIREMIRWYASHIGGTYDVQAYSAGSFRDKWEKLVAARHRHESNGDGEVSVAVKRTAEWKRKVALIDKIREKAVEIGYLNNLEERSSAMQASALPKILEAIGEKRDVMTYNFFVSMGREN